MRALLAALLVGASFAAFAPAAQAQDVGSSSVAVTVVDPAMAFQPGSEGFLLVYGRYNVNTGAVPTPDPDLDRGNGTDKTRITFAVKQMPSWVTSAEVEPPEILVEPALPSGQTTFAGVRVRLNVSPDAPALQREEIVVEAVAQPNGAIPGSRGESPAIKLRAAEVANANVTGPASPYVLEGGTWNVVPFTVRNDGNKDTRFLLNVTVRPEFSEVEFPKEVNLTRGESVEVQVRIRTPWTERETGTLELEATPLMEDDLGPATRYAVDVVGTSAVPGAGLA